MEAIENKYTAQEGDRSQARTALHAACDANSKYGDAAIKKAKAKLDKTKAKTKARTNAQKTYDSLKKSQENCHSKADVADIGSLDDDEFATAIADGIQAEQELVSDQKDSYAEDNDNWYEKADSAADKSIAQGEKIATRTADKASAADEKAYDKLAQRAAAALDRVEP
jgi:hypothetical protein